MLRDVVPPAVGADLAVAGALLVRVLAVAQLLLGALEGEVQAGRQQLAVGLVEPGDDGRVVGGGVGERLAGQARRVASASSPVAAQLVEHVPVVGRVDDDADVRVVLGRGPHHGGPAHVDHLDRRVGAERVEVAHHEVDGDDAAVVEGLHVLGLRPVGEHAAVDVGVQRLHPAVEHLGRAGDVLHLEVGDAGLGQGARRAAARHQLPPQAAQALGQGLEAGLVVHGQQRSHGWALTAGFLR